MISSFVALLLAAAAVQDAPVATSPEAPRPVAVAPKATEPPVPAGAPGDDYGLVAWCHGALRGHMELAEAIKDTLPLDEEQQGLGREYLKRYEDALAAAPAAKASDGLLRANTARTDGYRRWAPALTATDRQTQMFTYLGWQLPGRCDIAAERLTKTGDLLGAALAGPAQAPAETPAEPATQP
jgi:hypothetical protein